jgi:hypothetical protein
MVADGSPSHAVLASGVESSDPTGTGVDSWRVEIAHTEAQGYFAVATGSRDGSPATDVLELVVKPSTSASDGAAMFLRTADGSTQLDVSPARMKALAADFQKIAQVVHRDDGEDVSPLAADSARSPLLGDPSTLTAPGRCVRDFVGSAVGATFTLLEGVFSPVFCVLLGGVTVLQNTVSDYSSPVEACKDAVLEAPATNGKMTWSRMQDLGEACRAFTAGVPPM